LYINSNTEWSFPKVVERASSILNKFWMPACRQAGPIKDPCLLTAGAGIGHDKIIASYKHTLIWMRIKKRR
jgi:hypothetical protein